MYYVFKHLTYRKNKIDSMKSFFFCLQKLLFFFYNILKNKHSIINLIQYNECIDKLYFEKKRLLSQTTHQSTLL